MFNELRMPCALAVQKSSILSLIIDLVYKSEEVLRKTKSTPIWLSLVITLIDFQEKAAVCSHRKQKMHNVCFFISLFTIIIYIYINLNTNYIKTSNLSIFSYSVLLFSMFRELTQRHMAHPQDIILISIRLLGCM